MIFVNKLDRERASFERTLDQLRDRLGAGVAPLELPIGAEADFRGIADLLTDTAHLYEGGVPAHRARSPTRWRRWSTRCTTTWSRASWWPTTPCSSATSTGDVPALDELEHALTLGHRDAPASSRWCAARPPPRWASTGWPTSWWRSVPPPADRPTTVHGRRHRGGGGRRPRRPAARLRVQDHRRPVRRPGVAAQGAVGHDPQRRPPRQQPHRHRRAAPRPLRRPGQGPRAGRLAGGRRHRRRGQAVRHRHRRHAGPQGPARAGSPRSSSPSRCSPSRWWPRRRPTTTSWPPPCTASRTRTRPWWWSATRRPTRPSCGAPGETHLAITLERLERKFGVNLTTEDVRVRYRETISAPGRRRGPAQEAVGRPRPVRGGQRAARAAGARRRASSSSTRSSGGAISRAYIPAVAKGSRGGDGPGRA